MTSERELLQRWSEGDEEAGEQIYRRHFPMVYRFFRTKVAEGVEDLVQATFLACLEARDRFRGDSKFSTFVYGVARNQLLAHFRKVDRDRCGSLDFSVADVGTSPSGILGRNEAERALYEAMASLPVDHQIALELFYWEGLPSREIADVLDAPESTIRTRLRRARKRLQEAIDFPEDGPPQ